MPPDVGQIVGDRYRVARSLGQGGMGAVYRAWDTRLNRPVALKEMIPQAGLDQDTLEGLRQQFKQEAQILATLAHPSLVRVTDYFSWEGNEYLVMDFVEGESLAEQIVREGAQSESQVLDWAGQLLGALDYCHKRSVIHRDIKPQNIIITPEGRAVLVDFGLVKLWDPGDPHTRTVMRGAGTPEYAPPEQYDLGIGHTDTRSDIYSLGATLYHALTGRVPPTATQRMASPSSFTPPRLVNATIGTATEAAILKALEMPMELRFQSAQEMAHTLESVQVTPPFPREKRPPTPAEEKPPAKEKNRFLLGLGGVGVGATGLVCLALAVGAVIIISIIVASDGSTGPTSPSTTLPPNTVEPAILFQDDFGDPSSGWEVGDYSKGKVGYKDSAYFVISLSQGTTMWGVANTSFDDVIIEVDATQVSAGPEDNNDYGVVCREQSGTGDGYYLLISGDGYYSIAKAVEREFEWLVEWARSSAIQRGNATNHIRGVCNGDRLALWVNGELLAETQDTTFDRGDIALTATTYEEDPTEVHFDNLVVQEPSGDGE